MAEMKWGDDARFLAMITLPAEQLQKFIIDNKGARIGQSTVVSQKLHTFNPATPQEIHILQDTDAGQVFYNRRDRGKIFHLDIFHQCGLVDHHQVAIALKKAVNTYNFHYTIQNSIFYATGIETVKHDWIDVQTGTGGGRITGELNYGKKLSLRKAHENHVHVAIMIPVEHVACLFYIVAAVEEIILNSQLELRRNERIVHKSGGGSGSADLSPYSDQSDSFLREKQTGQMSETVKKHQYRQDASDLSEHFDSLQQVKEFLNYVEHKESAKKLNDYLERTGASEQALQRLEGLNIVDKTGKNIQLTEYGRGFKDHLDSHIPELEAHLRRSIRLVRPFACVKGRSPIESKSILREGQRQAITWSQGDVLGQLAIAETVSAAARRLVSSERNLLYIDSTDIHHMVKREKTKSEICLVIDASASMAGPRIRAAKFLARHLLLSTPDRIGVVVFQENDAKVQVPLTRDFNQVESSLSAIYSFGSTPLALGLKTCLSYLKEARARNPFIILITDGVPTVADSSNDPLTDAMVIAEDIKKQGYGFTCIGLKPHKNYLNQLTEAAGGSVYIFDELEKQVLVKAAWAECSQR